MTDVGLAPPPTTVSADLVATIGETPLVELHHVSPNPEVREAKFNSPTALPG